MSNKELKLVPLESNKIVDALFDYADANIEGILLERRVTSLHNIFETRFVRMGYIKNGIAYDLTIEIYHSRSVSFKIDITGTNSPWIHMYQSIENNKVPEPAQFFKNLESITGLV